eukprot:s1252_g6.t1
MALQSLLGLLRCGEEDEDTTQDHQDRSGPEVGRRALWHQSAIGQSQLAGNPERNGASEPHQEEVELAEPGVSLYNEIMNGSPFAEIWAQGGPLGEPSPTGKVESGGLTKLKQSWKQFKGWVSPSKRPRASSATRPEVPKLNLPKSTCRAPKKLDKLKAALLSARALKKRNLRNPSIEADFSASSSKLAKNAKKRTVLQIVEVLTGSKGSALPLTQEVLKGLASALRDGGYKAGEGYLIEAKLWHIEEGHPWGDTLDRAFKQCKRALARGQGPRKKALEVPRPLRDAPKKLSFAQSEKAVKFGRELFSFCVVWMLREIELADLTTGDVTIDHMSKKVSLHIKISKTDSEGRGVNRTLQCLCTSNKCDPECPYALSKDILEKVEKYSGTGSWLSMDKTRKQATKAQIVRTWRLMFGEGITGHSGRRTGALHYIRSGWSITQVAHLGRWKSSAILSYAEEALEQLPANLNVPSHTVDPKGIATYDVKAVTEDELKAWKAQLKKEMEELKGHIDEKGKENDEQVALWAKLYRENPGTLPRRVQSLTSKVVHWNVARASTSPPISWRSACGWAYYGSNFVFVEQEAEAKPRTSVDMRHPHRSFEPSLVRNKSYYG